MVPKDSAPLENVYYYFSKWKNEGVFEELLDKLCFKVRIMSGREESPGMGIINSRSVKTSHHMNSERRLDGDKKIKGMEQYIIANTQGNLMPIAVHETNIHGSKGAPVIIGKLSYKSHRLVKILADSGYRENLSDWVSDKFGWGTRNSTQPDECPSKFKVIPKRWIVERSFAWLENYESPLSTMSIMLTLPRLWFNLLSVRSCLTNLLNNFQTIS